MTHARRDENRLTFTKIQKKKKKKKTNNNNNLFITYNQVSCVVENILKKKKNYLTIITKKNQFASMCEPFAKSRAARSDNASNFLNSALTDGAIACNSLTTSLPASTFLHTLFFELSSRRKRQKTPRQTTAHRPTIVTDTFAFAKYVQIFKIIIT